MGGMQAVFSFPKKNFVSNHLHWCCLALVLCSDFCIIQIEKSAGNFVWFCFCPSSPYVSRWAVLAPPSVDPPLFSGLRAWRCSKTSSTIVHCASTLGKVCPALPTRNPWQWLAAQSIDPAKETRILNLDAGESIHFVVLQNRSRLWWSSVPTCKICLPRFSNPIFAGWRKIKIPPFPGQP